MGKRGKQRVLITLPVDSLTVWAEQVAGYTVKQIAERHSISTRCVFKWLAQAKQQLAAIPDIETMRSGLYALYPEAVSAIQRALRYGTDCGQIGLRLLQGLTVLTDKREIDVHDTRQLTSEQLRDELRRELGPVISGEAEKTERDNPRTTPS